MKHTSGRKRAASEAFEAELARAQEEIERLRSALERSERAISGILDGALDAVVQIDAAGIISLWNHTAEEMFGWSAEEVLGTPLMDTIIPPRFRDAHQIGMRRYLQTGEGPILNRRIEIHACNRRGREFPVELTVVPTESAEGEVQFLSFIRDRTEQALSARRAACETEVARHLSRARTLGELGDSVLQSVGTSFGWSVATLWCLDASENALLPLSLWSAPGVPSQELLERTRMLVLPCDSGLPGAAWKSMQPVWLEDICTFPNLPRAGALAALGLRSALAIPVIENGRLWGVLDFFHTELPEPSDADLEFFRSLGRDVALSARRIEAELTAQEAKSRLDALFQQTIVGIAITDTHGRFLSVNPHFSSMVQRSEATLMRCTMQEITHPEDLPRNLPLFEKLIEDGQEFSLEKRYVRPDGSSLWVHNTVLSLWDERRRSRIVIAISQDISDRKQSEAVIASLLEETDRELAERKRVENALRESEQHFRLLVDALRDYAVMMLDPLGRVVSWNRGAERINGYRTEEVLGKTTDLFYPEGERGSGAAERHLELAHRHGRFEEEGWRVRKDGSRYWANVVITPIRDTSGELLGYAKITRDLTERRQADQERELLLERERAVRAEAERTNRAKSDFLATMSHELRTPLNAIIGYVDLMNLGIPNPLPEPSLRQVERIGRSANHLLQVIEEILTFSRIEAGREVLHPQRFPMDDLIREVTAIIEPLSRAKGLHFLIEAPEEPILLETDPRKLRQILINLLGNAIKFTRTGSVEFGIFELPDTISFVIRDTGIGIAPEDVERIFEPFWQVDQGSTREAEGTGLGLSVVRNLVDLLGGEIAVTSTPGLGSLFSVQLPRWSVTKGAASGNRAS